MYSVYKLKIWDIMKFLQVSNILYCCGKDMAEKFDLHHWENSHFKNWIILAICMVKNQIYLVFDNKKPVATFQTKKIGPKYLFQKLAIVPESSGNGIGTFCLEKIESLAKLENCQAVVCEVYDKSEHAKNFYKNRGYVVYGDINTLKYRELKLKKEL